MCNAIRSSSVLLLSLLEKSKGINICGFSKASVPSQRMTEKITRTPVLSTVVNTKFNGIAINKNLMPYCEALKIRS